MHCVYCALRWLWLDGLYDKAAVKDGGAGKPVFHEAAPPSVEQLATLLDKIIRRIVKLLTRTGHLIEEEGVVYLANTGPADPDNTLTEW